MKASTQGGKALIFKLDDEKFAEMFGDKFSDVDLGDDNYLVAVIMDAKSSKIKARLLVISRLTVRNVANSKGIVGNILIMKADRTHNRVTFRDLETRDDWEITGTGIADDIHVGNKITV